MEQVPGRGAMLGELRIPRLKMHVPVREDCSPETLRVGGCHLTGTARFGGLGTVGIAGHRDASFRALRDIHLGDQVVLSGNGEIYRYQVHGTRIVQPEDVAVLDAAEQPGLVLITCYPFGYIGAAPQRFIVQAHLLSVDPTQ